MKSKFRSNMNPVSFPLNIYAILSLFALRRRKAFPWTESEERREKERMHPGSSHPKNSLVACVKTVKIGQQQQAFSLRPSSTSEFQHVHDCTVFQVQQFFLFFASSILSTPFEIVVESHGMVFATAYPQETYHAYSGPCQFGCPSHG